MDLKSLLRFCFVLLFCGQNFSLGCRWIRYRYKVVSRENLQLLTTMGGEFVIENVNTSFPNKVYSNARHSQMGDYISILYEVIRQIRKLYSKDMDSVTWDSVKLDRFQSNLHRVISELDQCKQEMTYSDSTRSHRTENRNLKRHFKKLEHYLKTKVWLFVLDYSGNAWEVVRTEVWKHLQRLDLLASAMRTKMKA
ncbi:interferon a3-like [Polyodon spathula]|uniref:interferon a3-like n=1 Tax=Polyodon spathula TaxID=7913 RepID=UPI001B7F70E6|nr:interferon a3-like [Polyodon spathula]